MKFALACGAGLLLVGCSLVSAATQINTNLVSNPGAEASVGSTSFSASIEPTAWVCSTGFSAVKYSIGGTSDLNATDGSDIDGDVNYFAGALVGATGSATQTLSLTDLSSYLDTGLTPFTISAYLGGYLSQDDDMTISVSFRNAADAEISRTTLPRVRAAERANETKLLFRSATGRIPAGTRTVQIQMLATRITGSYSDGYADNLFFGITTLPGDATLNGQVNFSDLLVLAKHYNWVSQSWAEGDFTGEGTVNFNDLLLLAKNYNQSVTSMTGLSSDFVADWALAQSLVPEPATLLVASVPFAGRRRRR